MPAVRCTCTGNAIITFFTPFDPAPSDKKCRSEHQTRSSFRFSGKGSGDGTREQPGKELIGLIPRLRWVEWERDCTPCGPGFWQPWLKVQEPRGSPRVSHVSV